MPCFGWSPGFCSRSTARRSSSDGSGGWEKPEARRPFSRMMFFAGLIEFFGGLLIAVGFQASWAAFLASGQMAVAYFMVHAPNAAFPIRNRGELAVLYCFAFLYIAARGSGTLSVDSLSGKPKKAD